MRTGSRGGPSRGPARVACRAARTRRWRFSGAFPCTERRLRASLGTCRERPLELCANEWRSGIRRTPQVACSACDHRELVPLSDAVLDRHLTGQCTVGVYPFFTDESCGGLRSISMRRNGARTRAFVSARKAVDVPVALEVSRSGAGTHAWIFLEGTVPVQDAWHSPGSGPHS